MAGAGFKDFTVGAKLTSAQVDTYLMQQSIMVFAGTTTRDASLSAGTVAEGMHVYESDTNTFRYYNGSAWVVLAEEPQAWSPTITQGGTVTGTVGRGYYQRSNGVFHAGFTWTATGAGTSTNAIKITTPVTLAHLEDIGGAISYRDTDVPEWRVGVVVPDTTGIFRFIIDQGTSEYGVAAADTIAANHVIRVAIQGRY